MRLTVTGAEIRRAIVLILHEESKPATTPIHNWTPRACARVDAAGKVFGTIRSFDDRA
jgi:hypothetical protein